MRATTWRWCVFILLLVNLVQARPGIAEEESTPEPPTPEQAAAAVLEAARTGDDAALTALANAEDPDPWIVADELCCRGAFDAAVAFAEAAPGTDAARLAAYVRMRRKRQPDEDVRAVLARVEGSVDFEDVDEVLAALEAQLGRGDAFEQVRVQTAYADILLELRRYEEAQDAYLAASRPAEALGWFAAAARAFEAAGMAAHRETDYEGMLSAWERLLGVQMARGDESGAARALMFVGSAYVEISDYERGRHYLAEARAAYEALGDDDGVAWVLNNTALLHHRCGERAAEQDVLETALALARDVNNEFRIACILADLGTLLFTLSDYRQAHACLWDAMQKFRAMDAHANVAMCLGNLGEVYRGLEDYDRSIAYIEEALAYHRHVRDSALVCAGLNDLGLTRLRQGELERAKELEMEAVAVGRTVAHSWYLCTALQSLAEVLLALGEYAEAKDRLGESLDVAAIADAPELLVEGHRGLAELWFAQGKHARAVEESRQAIELQHALLTGLEHGQAVRAREGALRLYGIAVRAADAWGRPEALLTAIESARAGALLETLENRDAIQDAAVPAPLREEETEARRELNQATIQLQRAARTGNRREMRVRDAAVARARSRLHLAIGRIRREAKRAANVLHPLPATLDELQRELGPKEAFVAYSLLGEQAHAIVVTNGNARAVALGETQAISDAAETRPTRADASATTSIVDLQARLIDPLGLSDATERLLISPDGILGLLPFSLLVPEREVAYVPSATAYCVLRSEKPLRGKGVLALGDPAYHAPETPQTAVAERGGMRLVPLPATGEEARRVGDVVLLGREATPRGFRTAVGTRPRWEAVHLACHGLVDSRRPMRSALALSFGEDEGNLLTCSDVFCMRIPADLAVLSACETGKGRIYRTEGIVGLTQAFMLAGAPRVLVSLWKVDDQATQALMVKFYEHWRPKEGRERMGAATALRKAQEDVRDHPQHPEWKHPYYWAAWVLWGLPD